MRYEDYVDLSYKPSKDDLVCEFYVEAKYPPASSLFLEFLDDPFPQFAYIYITDILSSLDSLFP
jgi:hypothetical protein